MLDKTAVLPTTYFGNIEYYSMLLKHDNIIIKAHEHYVKQTFRNRCVIATANGPLTLTVPVNYSNTLKTKTKDVTIDYSKNWQKQHFKAIESAYRKSPFYEFYIDDLMFVFENKEKYLLDLNMKILDSNSEILKIHNNIHSTSEYLNMTESYLNYRNNTKTPNNTFFREYNQIFIERFGFQENMSVLDLLFCVGEESKTYI